MTSSWLGLIWTSNTSRPQRHTVLLRFLKIITPVKSESIPRSCLGSSHYIAAGNLLTDPQIRVMTNPCVLCTQLQVNYWSYSVFSEVFYSAMAILLLRRPLTSFHLNTFATMRMVQIAIIAGAVKAKRNDNHSSWCNCSIQLEPSSIFFKICWLGGFNARRIPSQPRPYSLCFLISRAQLPIPFTSTGSSLLSYSIFLFLGNSFFY